MPDLSVEALSVEELREQVAAILVGSIDGMPAAPSTGIAGIERGWAALYSLVRRVNTAEKERDDFVCEACSDLEANARRFYDEKVAAEARVAQLEEALRKIESGIYDPLKFYDAPHIARAVLSSKPGEQ